MQEVLPIPWSPEASRTFGIFFGPKEIQFEVCDMIILLKNNNIIKNNFCIAYLLIGISAVQGKLLIL